MEEARPAGREWEEDKGLSGEREPGRVKSEERRVKEGRRRERGWQRFG